MFAGRKATRAVLLGVLMLPIIQVKAMSKQTVASRVDQYGTVVRNRLRPQFQRAGVAYPPSKLTIVVLKDERRLDLYASNGRGVAKLIKKYPVLAASGELGPKLREGDNQVPEGIYRIESLNPNSLYHLALRVNYPNTFDRRMAKSEGRKNLGGDIMIHGNRVSIGCVAVGDEAAEELFILAATAGLPNILAIFSPTDLRQSKAKAPQGVPAWTPELYAGIRAELAKLAQD